MEKNCGSGQDSLLAVAPWCYVILVFVSDFLECIVQYSVRSSLELWMLVLLSQGKSNARSRYASLDFSIKYNR